MTSSHTEREATRFQSCAKCRRTTTETVGKLVDGKWLCWNCYCDTQRHVSDEQEVAK